MAVKNVFICYRRDDAEGYAGRLYDRLNSRFPGRIFMDVTGISPGADFTRVIQERVGACSALIAIIGKQWLTMADDDDRRRLFQENDYVRHEIGTALKRNIAVIPVLVRDATMPTADTLPPDLAQLSFRNAIEITDTDFDHDVARLIEGLEFVFGERRPVAPPPVKSSSNSCLIIAIIAVLLGGVGILLLVVFGAVLSSQTGGTDDPSPQSSIAVQSPNPAPGQDARPVPANFNWEGSWTMEVEGVGNGSIVFNKGNTYESPRERGTWRYMPDQQVLLIQGTFYDMDTDTTQQFDAEVTIESRNGNKFIGRLYSKGVMRRVSLTRLQSTE